MGIGGYVMDILSAVADAGYPDRGNRKKYREGQYLRKEGQERLMDMYRVCREINHWRHDMLAELDVLWRMQRNGKYPEVEACLEKLCSGLKGYPELPQPTGNEGLDAALMKAVPGCRERGIRFRYAVLGRPGRIHGVAMGILMDNLLRNGMEACQDLPGTREMDLVVRTQGGMLEICLENSIGESVLGDNPSFASRKEGKERHGFGMGSIRRIVDAYGGTYECWEEKKGDADRFCQWICLEDAASK